VSNPTNPPYKPALPPALGGAVGVARAWFSRLSRPARILLFSTSALAALSVAFFAYQQTHEPYSVLFAQLEQDDATAMVAKLKEMKVPYRLDSGGSTIEVPDSKVADTRLELAGAGMPRGGGVGFESFDKMRLGATEFEQRVLYRRALEGELARTIGTLSSVQSARIHLVLAEKSVFVTRAEPASASIVLRLRPGRVLGPSEVAGIVHLTAASVPGLTAERIALVTTDGQMLKKPHPSAAEGASFEADADDGSPQHTIESQLEDRVRSMLERVVGAGHVDVRVAAETDPAQIEHVEDHYDPARTALRSEEVSLERAGGVLEDTVAGVPGAESSLPMGGALSTALASTSPAKGDAGAPAKGDAGAPATGVASNAVASSPFRESHTRNYEVDHVSDKRVVHAGSLKRITVAVVLDGVARTEGGKTIELPRDPAELEKLRALVRSAVGASDARGDVVTVDSAMFDTAHTPVEGEASVVAPAAVVKTWRSYRPAALAAAVVLALAVGATAWAGRRRPTPPSPVLHALPSTAAPATQLEAKKDNVDARAAATQRAAEDPATAALVIRAWLGATDADTKPIASRA
jgi:flagellar M-ring protein FliF